MMSKKIKSSEIEKILGFKIDRRIKQRVESFDLKYKKLSKKERDTYVLNIINVLTNDIVVSGKHRITEWESGWDENLNLFMKSNDVIDLIPKYHGKNRIVRWMGEPVMPLTENFDYKIHILFVDSILQEYSKNLINLFEFGCGPGYHLIRMNNLNPKLNLYGLDWTKSSQSIIKEINTKLNLSIGSENFDFFNPNFNLSIPEKSGFFTVAALEQIGENFTKFVDFILEKKPEICIHLEPIDELLDDTNLIDSLSIKYFRKRNYLKNFLPYLEKLENEGKIEIINKKRIFTGSYFIEGHSLIVWKPL